MNRLWYYKGKIYHYIQKYSFVDKRNTKICLNLHINKTISWIVLSSPCVSVYTMGRLSLQTLVRCEGIKDTSSHILLSALQVKCFTLTNSCNRMRSLQSLQEKVLIIMYYSRNHHLYYFVSTPYKSMLFWLYILVR